MQQESNWRPFKFCWTRMYWIHKMHLLRTRGFIGSYSHNSDSDQTKENLNLNSENENENKQDDNGEKDDTNQFELIFLYLKV